VGFSAGWQNSLQLGDGWHKREWLAVYLRLVEAEVLRAGDGGLGGRGQVLPRLASGLYL